MDHIAANSARFLEGGASRPRWPSCRHVGRDPPRLIFGELSGLIEQSPKNVARGFWVVALLLAQLKTSESTVEAASALVELDVPKPIHVPTPIRTNIATRAKKLILRMLFPSAFSSPIPRA